MEDRTLRYVVHSTAAAGTVGWPPPQRVVMARPVWSPAAAHRSRRVSHFRTRVKVQSDKDITAERADSGRGVTVVQWCPSGPSDT